MRVAIIGEQGSADISKLITRVSRKYVPAEVIPEVWTHVLLGFDNGYGFESHIRTGWVRVKLADLALHNSTFWHVPLTLSEEEGRELYGRCRHDWGKVPYDIHLIGRLWLHARLRIPVGKNAAKWDCSEAVARQLVPWLDLLELCRRAGFDVGENADKVFPAMIQYVLYTQQLPGLPQWGS